MELFKMCFRTSILMLSPNTKITYLGKSTFGIEKKKKKKKKKEKKKEKKKKKKEEEEEEEE